MLGTNAVVQSQHVTDPASSVQVNAYSTRTTTAAGQAGVGLTLFGSTVFLFYQRLSDLHVCYQTSADGASWSSEQVATATSVRVWGIASAGNGDLFLAQNASSDSAQEVVFLTYSSGVFSVGSTWTNSSVRVMGMSAVYAGGSYRIAMGAQSRSGGAVGLTSMSYAGGAWSALSAIHGIDDPLTGLSAPYPGLALIDGTYRVASVLMDSGEASGLSAQRCEVWISPDFVHWHLEQIVATTAEYGLHLVLGPLLVGGWILAGAGILTLSTAAAGSVNPDMDISDALLSLVVEEPANDTITGLAVVDNHGNGFTPVTPPRNAFHVGAQVRVSHGYAGTTVLTHTLFIDAIEQVNAETLTPTQTASGDIYSVSATHLHSADWAVVVLHLSNRVRRLEAQAHTDRVQAAATLAFEVAEVAIAGGALSVPTLPATAQFSQTVAAFGISSHGTFRHAFDRLANLYGFDWFADENEQMQVREPLASDTSSYAYGAGDVQTIGHQLKQVREPNYIKVVGKSNGANPLFADAMDDAAIQNVGEVVHLRVTDRMLTTAGQVQIKAALELRKAQRGALHGWARIPLNPALQPLDVISISDESLTAIVRLTKVTWITDFQNNRFEQLVQLQAP